MSHYDYLLPENQGKANLPTNKSGSHYDYLLPGNQGPSQPSQSVSRDTEQPKEQERFVTPLEGQWLVPGKPAGALDRLKQAVRERTGLFEPPIYGEKYRGEQPIRDIGRIGAHYTSDYLSGLGLNVPDIIAGKISGEESLSAAVDKLTGFKPTPGEIAGGEAIQFVGGLKSAGKISGMLVQRIAARQALKTMLAAGLQFGTRAAAEQTADRILKGQPFNLEGIHFEAGMGVLFGAGEEGVRSIARFVRGVRSPKALAQYKPPEGARMSPEQARVYARVKIRQEVETAKKAGGKEWERVMRKYAGWGQAAEPVRQEPAKSPSKPYAPATTPTPITPTPSTAAIAQRTLSGVPKPPVIPGIPVGTRTPGTAGAPAAALATESPSREGKQDAALAKQAQTEIGQTPSEQGGRAAVTTPAPAERPAPARSVAQTPESAQQEDLGRTGEQQPTPAATEKAKGKEVKIKKSVSATDHSVRDLSQQATIKDDIITVTSKVGRKMASKYEVPLSEWERTEKGPSANPNYNKAMLVKKYTPGMDEEPGGVEQAQRIRDSQVYAIEKAIKKATPTPPIQGKGNVDPAKWRRQQGFARVPQIADFENVGKRLREMADKLANPDEGDAGSVFKAIEKWRGETNLAGVYADWSLKSLNKIPGMGEQKRLVTRWLDNPAKYQAEFDKLPMHLQGMGLAVKADYERLRDLAQKHGILESWIENYSPHIYRDDKKRLWKSLYPQGGKAGTKFRFAKQRTFETLDDARKAGLHPIEDPALLNAIYRKQLFRTVANKNLVELLKKLKDENGVPLLMGRPRDPALLKIYDNDYRFVNVPALNRFMYVGETTTGEAKEATPKLIQMPVKANPEVARLLEQALSPWSPQSNAIKTYMLTRGMVKRIIMLNPAIHGWNIFSDALDEMNFRPIKTLGAFATGHKLYATQDAMVERATRAGLQIQTGHGLSQEIREQLYESPTAKELNRPDKWLLRKSDDLLWNGIVRNAQLGLFKALTERIAAQHPDWSQERIDRLVTTHINTQLGTLPHTWLGEGFRHGASIAMFARNWTLSNIDLVVRAMTMGRKGFGVKALDPAQKTKLGLMNIEHLVKGIMGLIGFTALSQLAFLSITNKLKRKGIISGQEQPLHTQFRNERGHWIDTDTGLQTNRGQKIYLTPPLFRYIRDYIGYTTEPGRTLYNKMEPLLKQAMEQMANYSIWQREEIAKSGAPTWDRLVARAKYFVDGVSPSSVFGGRPGYKNTLFETLIPFSGTWIRRGAPGGKFTEMLFEFRDIKGYERDKVDEKIDEKLQGGEWDEAFSVMADSQRYADSRGPALRIMKMVSPLNYYMMTTPNKERDEFVEYLGTKGFTKDDLLRAMERERAAIELRGE